MKLSNSFKISSHTIGDGNCFIIAEIAQAHDGSLGLAHSFIDSVAKTGAHAIKFQTHIADAESSSLEPWRVKFSLQDETRFDYWKRMEFTKEQWAGLKTHAEDLGLVFLSSPFSVEAVELLQDIGVVAWKISSGEISNQILLNRICETRKPILVSTGMSKMSEIEKVVNVLSTKCSDICVMQCTTSYPTPPEELGLNIITEYKNHFNCPVGLSDHSGTIYAGLAAATIGIDILEIHVTLNRQMFGPDVIASVTTDELSTLVSGIKFIEKAMSNPVVKDIIFDKFVSTKNIFGRSLFFKCDLNAGIVLDENHFIIRKPGTGIDASEIPNIIGKTLIKNVKANQILSLTDFQ